MSCLGHKSAVFVEVVNVRSCCKFYNLILNLCTFLSKNFNSLCNLSICSNSGFLAFVCTVLICRAHNLRLRDTSCLTYLNTNALLHQGHKSLVSGVSFGHNFTSIQF